MLLCSLSHTHPRTKLHPYCQSAISLLKKKTLSYTQLLADSHQSLPSSHFTSCVFMSVASWTEFCEFMVAPPHSGLCFTNHALFLFLPCHMSMFLLFSSCLCTPATVSFFKNTRINDSRLRQLEVNKINIDSVCNFAKMKLGSVVLTGLLPNLTCMTCND